MFIAVTFSCGHTRYFDFVQLGPEFATCWIGLNSWDYCTADIKNCRYVSTIK